MAGVILAAGGCGHPTVVDGEVFCDGKPLENGRIVFLPVDGQGPSCGGVITAGKYRLELPPGRKVIDITGQKRLAVGTNKVAEAAYARVGAKPNDGTYLCVDPTVAAAAGNHTEVDVNSGKQTFDFSLKRKE